MASHRAQARVRHLVSKHPIQGHANDEFGSKIIFGKFDGHRVGARVDGLAHSESVVEFTDAIGLVRRLYVSAELQRKSKRVRVSIGGVIGVCCGGKVMKNPSQS